MQGTFHGSGGFTDSDGRGRLPRLMAQHEDSMSADQDELAGLRIVIAEDHWAISLALSSLLEDFGCVIAGTATDHAAAEQIVTTADADCAIIDVDLGTGSGYTAAAMALERGMAVILSSGYDDPPSLPAHLADVPRLLKPVTSAHLQRALREVAAARS